MVVPNYLELQLLSHLKNVKNDVCASAYELKQTILKCVVIFFIKMTRSVSLSLQIVKDQRLFDGIPLDDLPRYSKLQDFDCVVGPEGNRVS